MELPVIGQIILIAIGAAGATIAIVNLLRSYFQIKPSLMFELQKKNGDKLRIQSDDLGATGIEAIVSAINRVIEEDSAKSEHLSEVTDNKSERESK